MICDCIELEIIIEGEPNIVFVYPNGNIVNGAPQFENVFLGTIIFVQYDLFLSSWTTNLAFFPFFASISGSTENCPIGLWNVEPNVHGITNVESFECDPVPVDCGCVRVCMSTNEFDEQCIEINVPTGFFNNKPYYQFTLFGENFELLFGLNGPSWVIDNIAVIGQPPNNGAEWFNSRSQSDCPKPIVFNSVNDFIPNASTSDCLPCKPIEDRTFREFKSIRLPKQFIEQKRGFDECCSCPPMLTLASNENETWKNDVTSAWIKLSDQMDTAEFVLEKNGQSTIYEPVSNVFVNEQFSFYTTIKWIDVLNLDGIGCFTLKINFNISGINGSLIWGVYDLREYSIENALETARIKVKYNLKQEIEQIDFTGSNVVDTFRFYGLIGKRQPNMEIDNLIYQNREMKSVVRENLNKYIIETDPLEECQISKLTDLLLLSENELFISDYNAHNHSYKILDIPVIVEESPEIDYLDKYQRRAILKCVVGDKFKNKRTYFK
jgi:hypothetical protein